MRSLVIDFYRLNTSNDLLKKKKKSYYVQYLRLACIFDRSACASVINNLVLFWSLLEYTCMRPKVVLE